jgi:hypothetical protein
MRNLEDDKYRQGRSRDRMKNSEDLAAIGIIGIIVVMILIQLFGVY